MKQSNGMRNYRKLVDKSVELVLLVDLQEDSYEIVYDAGRMVWEPKRHDTYSSFVKYIEKHIEEEDQKGDLQRLFSLQSYPRNGNTDETVEKEYRITLQGGYENISLFRYQMEEIAGYEHSAILVVRLLTSQIEEMKKQAGLLQVGGTLCQMAVLVRLHMNQVSYLILPEELQQKENVNLPMTYEGLVHELVESIHPQEQEIVAHILSREYMDNKLSNNNKSSNDNKLSNGSKLPSGDTIEVQVRCKGADDTFHDIELVCAEAKLPYERDQVNFILMVKNITAEKKKIDELQQQIQQLEKRLEQVKEEKEELYSVIAKELHRR